MRKLIASAVAGLAVAAGVALIPNTASAGPGDKIWVANGDSKITSENVVTLDGGNTSVEAADLKLSVSEETEVTFTYQLGQGTECTGGAPRVFLFVNGSNHNSWDQLQPSGKQCGDENQLVTFKIPAGKIGQAGVVYDNGKPGQVVISNLKIGNKLINFTETEPLPTIPTPTATASATASPTLPVPPSIPATNNPAPSPITTPSGGAALPVTGDANSGKIIALLGLSGIMLLLGGGAILAFRRRKVEFRA